MSDIDDEETPPPLKRKCYSLQFKLEAIEYAEKTDKSSAAKKFKINRRQIQKWSLQKVELQSQSDSNPAGGGSKRLEGAGRPLKEEELDSTILSWILHQRAQKMRVTRNMIKKKAQSLNINEELKKEPEEFQRILVDYILYTSQLCEERQYRGVYAADETAVWIDCSNSLTVATKGVKEVSVKTTGHDKLRVTVMLTARSDGYKLKPFVLLPRRRPDPQVVEKFKGSLELCWNGSIWMCDATTSDYLQRILGTTLFGPRLLAWDSFRSHTSENTKKKLKALKIDTVVVPGGCTKFVQSPDVYWNAPFKSRFREQYESWMLQADKRLTKGGNVAAPSMELYFEWIRVAWENLPTDLISRSFPGCGLMLPTDGSADDKIYCFRPEGPIPAGRDLLRQAREEQRIADMANILGAVGIEDDDDDHGGSDSDLSVDVEFL